MAAPAASAGPRHSRMLGASLVSRLPGARATPLALERADNGLFLLWLAYMGLLIFGAWMLWQAGAWHRLIEADPTRLTLVIIVLFFASSVWAGRRAWALGQQRQHLDRHLALASFHAVNAEQDWGAEYQGCARPNADHSIWLQILGERAHGSHEMAWWLNGIQLKLGLLGKVIGFSILALHLGQMESFDASQSSLLLKNLTGGLGIALLTTVTGLTGNILLGLQLMRLDRFADQLVADTLAAKAPIAPAPESTVLATATEEPPHGDRPSGS
jgi:hypothetical protein